MSETAANTGTQSGNSSVLAWLTGISALLGGWIVAMPFVVTGTVLTRGISQITSSIHSSIWNNIIIGVAIFLIAGYNF